MTNYYGGRPTHPYTHLILDPRFPVVFWVTAVFGLFRKRAESTRRGQPDEEFAFFPLFLLGHSFLLVGHAFAGWRLEFGVFLLPFGSSFSAVLVLLGSLGVPPFGAGSRAPMCLLRTVLKMSPPPPLTNGSEATRRQPL